MRAAAVLLILLEAQAAVAATTAHVLVVDGNVILQDANGQRHQVVSDGTVTEATFSNDRRWIAYLRNISGPKLSGPRDDHDPQEIWIVSRHGRQRRRLMRTEHKAITGVDTFVGLFGLRFNRDGTILFFDDPCAAVSNCSNAISVATGRVLFQHSGQILEHLDGGLYADHILVEIHRYCPCGGSYQQLELLSPFGKDLFMVCNGEELGEVWPLFIKANNARNRRAIQRVVRSKVPTTCDYESCDDGEY